MCLFSFVVIFYFAEIEIGRKSVEVVTVELFSVFQRFQFVDVVQRALRAAQFVDGFGLVKIEIWVRFQPLNAGFVYLNFIDKILIYR